MGAYENLQKVKEEIENRRLSALAQADMRNLEVREKSEVIREIDRELELTGPMLFGKACRGEDIRPLMKKNMELMQKRKQELVKLGYPEDYTEVHYFCKKCSGIYIRSIHFLTYLNSIQLILFSLNSNSASFFSMLPCQFFIFCFQNQSGNLDRLIIFI